MNFGDLRVAVRHKLGLSAADQTAPNDVVGEALNEANQSISTERDWPWLYQEVSDVTTAESADITLPTNLTRIIFLTVDGAPLTHQGMAVSAGRRTDSAGAVNYGVPTNFTQAGSVLKLSPVPAAGTAHSYVLGFYGTEPLLEEDSDSPLLPPQFHGWLVARAALLVAIRGNAILRIPVLQAEDVEWEKRVIDNVQRAIPISGIRRTRESIWQDV